MAKKNVTVTLDPAIVSLAKTMKINLSETLTNALERVIRVNLEYMKQNAKSIEDLAKEKLENSRIIQEENERITIEQQQIRKEMLLHARAAKEAGIERWQAEMDYGHVFPDAVWNGE
jgi:hypothetical protein